MRYRDPRPFFVSAQGTLRDAAACIDRNRGGIALVVDINERLADTVTDGDVRRAVLAGALLSQPLVDFGARRHGSLYSAPVTASTNDSADALLAQLRAARVRQLPVVDVAGRVVDLVFVDDLAAEVVAPAVRAVVMAGGFGLRLGELTRATPKPMLPVGDRPLLEHIVDQLRDAGIRQVSMATHFRSEVIKDHFGDGARFGVDIAYVDEEQPLGTAGALSYLADAEEPTLVMNGDILTRLDVPAMVRFHRDQRADATVAVRQHEVRVPFGVVEAQAGRVTAIREKPTHVYLVNAGVYLLEPSVIRGIPGGARMDMPELLQRLIEDGRVVASFAVLEYWLDVGRPDDYARAQIDVAKVRANEQETG